MSCLLFNNCFLGLACHFPCLPDMTSCLFFTSLYLVNFFTCLLVVSPRYPCPATHRLSSMYSGYLMSLAMFPPCFVWSFPLFSSCRLLVWFHPVFFFFFTKQKTSKQKKHNNRKKKIQHDNFPKKNSGREIEKSIQTLPVPCFCFALSCPAGVQVSSIFSFFSLFSCFPNRVFLFLFISFSLFNFFHAFPVPFTLFF